MLDKVNISTHQNPVSTVENLIALSEIVHKQTKHKNSINLFYMNIRSMRKNFNLLTAELSPILANIDILILVETNLTADEVNFFDIPDFNMEYINREEKRGGGIMTYISKKYQYTIAKNMNADLESISINLNINEAIISVACVYRPPNMNNNSKFFNELDKLFDERPKKKDKILVGDMNIDLFKKNPFVSDYLDIMSSKGLLNCNPNEVTREDLAGNTKTNIDHIFAKQNCIDKINTKIVKTLISDHFSIFAELSVNCDQYKNISKKSSMVTIIDDKKVNESIKKVNWTKLAREETDPNSLYMNLEKKLNNIYSDAKKELKLKKRTDSKWINSDIMKMCSQRDRLYKKWKCRPKDNDKKRSIQCSEIMSIKPF